MISEKQQTPICPSCGHPIFEHLDSECPTVGNEETSDIPKMDSTTDLGRFTNSIVEEVLDDLTITFDFNLYEQNFTFHGRDHSADVIRRSVQILEILREHGEAVSEKDLALAYIAAAFHDVKQAWEAKDVWEKGSDDARFGKKIRARKTQANEIGSAKKAEEAMISANQQAGYELFTEDDRTRVAAAIEGTIPKFDPQLGTIIQPRAETSEDILVRAIALADLGEAGMTGPRAYLEGGDKLFVEENIDMWDLHPGELSNEQKAYYKRRMDDWNASQPTFALGRKNKLADEIATFTEAVRPFLEKEFSAFDDSITAAQTRADQRRAMNFEELYRDMGFMPSQEKQIETAA